VSLSDWLLFLHVLSAFLVVGGLTALWGLVIATRPGAPMVAAEEAQRFGRIAGPIVGVGMGGSILLGIALAIDSDDYHPWDGWIIAALVLWFFAGWAGAEAGKRFERDPAAGRAAGIRFHALNSLGVLAILVLMIWKPGA
jgi:Predicted integral membrane protein (DUF2269)